MASQEKREFDKYLKFFTQKAVQIIIQSREGIKLRTRCNPNETEWFNLVLPDKRDIVSELKRNVDPPLPQHNLPINVEITVEAPEGDNFTLEIWHIHLDTSKRDVTVSVSHSLYPRMSLLLKSLIAMTRAVPSYQLSRKNEDIKFGYRISSGFTELLKSEDVQNATLGDISSPYGLVSLSVEYTTQFVRPERVTTDTSLIADQNTSLGSPKSTGLRHPLCSSTDTQLTSLAQPSHPFAAVLPRPIPTSLLRTPSTENGTPVEDNSLTVERKSSGDIQAVTVRSNNDGYLVLDLNETKPAFGTTQTSDFTQLLQLSSDPPLLDLFTEGTDVTLACNYLDRHVTLKPQTS